MDIEAAVKATLACCAIAGFVFSLIAFPVFGLVVMCALAVAFSAAVWHAFYCDFTDRKERERIRQQIGDLPG